MLQVHTGRALFSLLVALLLGFSGCFIGGRVLFEKQASLEATTSAILWTYRQDVFHRFSNVLSRSETFPENEDAGLEIQGARETIKHADKLMKDGNVSQALTDLRSVGYFLDRAENFLTCHRTPCF